MSRADSTGFGWLRVAVRQRMVLPIAMGLLSAAACARSDERAGDSEQQLTSEDGSTGVALCDSYLDQYENCVIPGLPSSQVQRHRAGIVRQRQAWSGLADTPAKRDSLLLICRSAIEVARREFPACGFSDS